LSRSVYCSDATAERCAVIYQRALIGTAAVSVHLTHTPSSPHLAGDNKIYRTILRGARERDLKRSACEGWCIGLIAPVRDVRGEISIILVNF